ncbi:VanW family protein [Paraclostridium ghonii]|uniref:VanW family protein n=1 Tax=Paraclostridium ghonii TaxID=29358 RepID=UPI00202D086A|nr:VanW family protein [Paeniclostridium ghonii]MCM0167094.1 VanW family protein [Paeniclostridium ghonii]
MQQNIAVEEKKESVKSHIISKKNACIIVAIILFLIVIAFIGIKSFNSKYIYNGKIATNVYIGNVNVSDITPSEAKIVVSSEYKPKNIQIDYDDKAFSITPNQIDLKYDVDKAVEDAYNFNKTDSYFKNVKRVMSLKQDNKETIDIKPVYSDAKLESSLEEISKKVNKKVSNAKLNISDSGGFSITPEVIGKQLNTKSSKENIKKCLDENKFSAMTLVVNNEKPSITADTLKSVDSLLATHSTSYTNSSANRAHNIIKASNSTSNILLMPGEEFSYNQSTGPRSKSNGYKDAPVIVNGKVEAGSGGGVCQVSTTIYNSALYSGLDITNVRNHSLPSTYAPKGKDATVSDGSIDLKFKNPYKHPIYIKNEAYNGVITSTIYGSSKDKQKISVVTENAGSSNVVKTYREFKDSNGNITKKEYITTSSYKKK